ncbi:MAG: FtsL-like putative cell division protein [Bacteroidota bacterium]
MATAVNTIRNKERKSGNAGSSLFSRIDKTMKLDAMFSEGVPVQYLPRVLWLFMFALIYIANAHYANKTQKNLAKTLVQVEELRVDYTTNKAAYMQQGMQSSVARNVSVSGLEESSVPPRKIKLEEEE